MTDGNSAKARRRQWVKTLITKPSMIGKILDVRKWSERTVIALVMQNVDSSMAVTGKRGIFGWRLTSKNDSEHPNATYIPAANEVVRKIAKNYGGTPGGHIGDLVSAPFTAHFVGGCVISDDPNNGVIDPYHRVWNYPTLHVVDGASVTANLGVNPSLTITAQAERAFSFWPNKGESDPRQLKEVAIRESNGYAPNSPFVPEHAYGALRVN